MDFHIVTGPPCSGKSTWIAEHAGDADVFAREGLDNDPARVARDRAEFVQSHAGRPGACYIEACRMPKLAVCAGDTVTHIPLKVDEATCLGRLGASDRGRKARWREVIRSYFSESGPVTGPFHTDTSPHGDEGPHGPESEDPMADDATAQAQATEQTAPEATPEPQGAERAETDWKAEARKWEDRAKANRRQIDELTKTLDGFKSEADKQTEAEKTAAQTIDELKAQLAEAHAKAEREALVRKIAKSTGADAEILLRMLGNDEETITANAKMLLEASKPSWQSAPDEGAHAKAPRMSRDEILAIKSPKERLRMIAQNQDLFRE